MGLVEDELGGLDGIDPEQLRQMMSDPRYAALFAAHCKYHHYNKELLSIVRSNIS